MALEREQVFIVDDDESVCRSLKILLSTYDFKVETFNSADKFFSSAPNRIPGCLVLDIHMPGLDGWEALKLMIKSGSKRPVIIITADKDGGLRERALKIGAVGFLQKPFDDQLLVDLIKASVIKKEYK
jgi:two-component system response regulator FixJ